jgi:TonB family protein
MSNRWHVLFGKLVLLAALAGAFVCAPGLRAQEEVHRKARKEVKPNYPPLARQMHIIGTVRLEVTIAPNGKVKISKVLGGHPVLALAATEAAKRWEFEPSDKESLQVLEFKFAEAGS